MHRFAYHERLANPTQQRIWAMPEGGTALRVGETMLPCVVHLIQLGIVPVDELVKVALVALRRLILDH